jgi:hypothetical protein
VKQDRRQVLEATVAKIECLTARDNMSKQCFCGLSGGAGNCEQVGAGFYE